MLCPKERQQLSQRQHAIKSKILKTKMALIPVLLTLADLATTTNFAWWKPPRPSVLAGVAGVAGVLWDDQMKVI